MRRRGSLWITAALVAAVLFAGPAAPAWAADGGSTTLGRLWDWLAEVLSWELPAAASSDQCSSIDPNGHCLAGAQANSDQGSSIDPDG